MSRFLFIFSCQFNFYFFFIKNLSCNVDFVLLFCRKSPFSFDKIKKKCKENLEIIENTPFMNVDKINKTFYQNIISVFNGAPQNTLKLCFNKMFY